MVATRTSTKKTNRERARMKRAELDAERARRDAAIESAAAAFFDADDERALALARLDEIDGSRALAVGTLVELKETNSRIAQLLEIPTAEVRRLRDLIEGDGVESSGATSQDLEGHDGEGTEGGADAESTWSDAVDVSHPDAA